MWMATLVIIYFELEVVREVKGCNKESIIRRMQLWHTKVLLFLGCKLLHDCIVNITQKCFTRFAGEDLFKRSEEDRVLEYAVHLSTYEVMI